MRPSAWQIVVIVLIIVVLVGYKRLPDVARSVGRSMRIFKSEVEQLADSDDTESSRKDTFERDEPRARDSSTRRIESAPDRPDDDIEPRRG